MTLVKWTPFRDMMTLQDRMNRFFDVPYFRPDMPEDGFTLANWHPTVDIYDNDDKFVINAELPGMDKKDVHVTMEDHVLTLTGERRYENEEKDELLAWRL